MTGARVGLRYRAFGSSDPWSVAVTIPARNEARRIIRCLEAASRSLRGRGGIVLVVNGSDDGTFFSAQSWFELTGTTGLLLNIPEVQPGGVGEARRIAVTACAGRLAPRAAVMTTDADSRVFPDWVDANLDELQRADLVCGSVFPDPREFARLPPVIAQRGALEGEYMQLTIACRMSIDPVPHDPEPPHLSAPGASLAFRMDLYHDVGGIPALAASEDRAFARIAEARGWRIRHSPLVRVTTSCRLGGRAPDGMARALSARIDEPDPLVDEVLEPARQTVLRARLSRDLRALMADGRASEAARAQVRKALSGLTSTRMRLSDLERELPLLADAVRTLSPESERQMA